MELHEEQIESYDRDGYLLIPDLLREPELPCVPHPNTAHPSAANLSPCFRRLELVARCRLDNVILPGAAAAPRPDVFAERRPRAVLPLAVDRLPGTLE